MDNLFLLWFGVLVRLFSSRGKLVLENLALRQQLAVLKRRHPRPQLDLFDKLFWVTAHRFWSVWKEALIVVTPEMVVRWHRAGFRFYWRLISRVRKPAGRRRVSREVRDLIFRMVVENPTWGAPRIHGELLMLGFDVSERTISRWMRRAPRDHEPAKRMWTVQQLREAFPFGSAPRFVIFDRDAKYGAEVPAAIRSMKIKCVRTSLRSPWQNGIAERWVESCRRDLLDHAIALNRHHLRRLLADYVGYYHDDRTHLGLEKGTPNGRIRALASGRVLSGARLGGLHHRYDRAA